MQKEKHFIVEIREVWISSYKIEAKTKEEAIKLAVDGYADGEHLIEGSEEYSHTLPSSTWTAYEEK